MHHPPGTKFGAIRETKPWATYNDKTKLIRLDIPHCGYMAGTPKEMADLAFELLAKAREGGLDLGDDSEPAWSKARMMTLIARLETIIRDFLSNKMSATPSPVEPLKFVHPIRHNNPTDLLTHMQHCLWMLTEMPKFVEANRIRKFNRWLSDIGGVLRTLGIVTLDDLRNLFAPDGAEINHTKV